MKSIAVRCAFSNDETTHDASVDDVCWRVIESTRINHSLKSIILSFCDQVGTSFDFRNVSTCYLVRTRTRWRVAGGQRTAASLVIVHNGRENLFVFDVFGLDNKIQPRRLRSARANCLLLLRITIL